MAIQYSAQHASTRQLLQRMGFSRQRIDSEKPITNQELKQRGLNPRLLTSFATPKREVTPESAPLRQDVFLDARHATRALRAIENAGGMKEFARLTATNTCHGRMGNLRYFIGKQALREEQLYSVGNNKSGAAAIQQPCRYDATAQQVMHGGVFPVRELPQDLQRQALPSVVRILRPDGEGGHRGTGTAVVISPHGHVLTNRHLTGAKSNHRHEKKTGSLKAGQTERMPEGRIIRFNGRDIQVTEQHVLYRYPGHDLTLLHIPELAGHPHTQISATQPEEGTAHFIMGYPGETHGLANKQRVEAAYSRADTELKQCMKRAQEDFEQEVTCENAHSDFVDSTPWATNISNAKVLKWSTGHFMGHDAFPSDETWVWGQYHSSATLRPGMSGGPVFVREQGQVRLAGIANQVILNTTDDDSNLTRSSAGSFVTNFRGHIQLQIDKSITK